MNAPREPFLEAGSPTFNLEDLKAPNPLLLMLEARAPWEYLAMLAAGATRLRSAPALPT